MNGQRVVVIGAGLAGLAAAWRLERRGFEVAVLESGALAGGRLAGAALPGFRTGRGGHVFSSADRELYTLLGELGLLDQVRAFGPPGLMQARGEKLRGLDASSRLGVARIPGVKLREAARLVRLGRLLTRYAPRLDAAAPERAAVYDDRSLDDFATLYFGPSVAARWIGPATTCGTLLHGSDTSRLVYLLRAASHRSAAPVLLAQGMTQLPEVLASKLNVRTNARAVRIESRSEGGYYVRFESSERAGTLGADAVLLATPPDVAETLCGELLISAERDFLRGVSFNPGLTLVVTSRRALWRGSQRVLVPHAEESPIESITLEAGEDGGGLAVALTTQRWADAQAGASDEVVAKELVSMLERYFPGLAGEIVSTEVRRWERAMPRFDVGSYRALAGFRDLQAELRGEGRRLYFAGDYLIGPWLEAAVSSGFRSASEVFSDQIS